MVLKPKRTLRVSDDVLSMPKAVKKSRVIQNKFPEFDFSWSLFLAVQDSSIGDLVTHSVSQ